MHYPDILHRGAVAGVAGSCHELHAAADTSFQGDDTSSVGQGGRSALHIDFPLNTVRAIIATHVHVRPIPCLPAAGFKEPILCSGPSTKLPPIALEDAFKLGIGRNQRYISLVQPRIIALPYNQWFTLSDTGELVCRVRLLGSAYVELDLSYPKVVESKRIVLSGDLGAPHAPSLPAPTPPYRADILVIESTYGDCLHEDRRTRRQRLKNVVEQALRDNGTVLIPAFSIGRTQELLYELEEIIYHSQTKPPIPSGTRVRACDGNAHACDLETNWPELPIILDSPLASQFTAAYRQLQPFWNQEALKHVKSGRRPLGFEQLTTIDSHSDYIRMVQHLARTARPAIVIADNGMCSSGRIVNYLKAMLGGPRYNALSVGYQWRERLVRPFTPLARRVVMSISKASGWVQGLTLRPLMVIPHTPIKMVCSSSFPEYASRRCISFTANQKQNKRWLRGSMRFTKAGNKPCTSPSRSKAPVPTQ